MTKVGSGGGASGGKKAGLKRKAIEEGGAGAGTGEGEGEGAAAAEAAESSEEEDAAAELPALPDRAKYPNLGVLPRVLRSLVVERGKVKSAEKLEKDPVKKASLDIRQKALKILANSMYGCLGFPSSRFYARPIAALVTAKGREIFLNTVDLATKNHNLEVIYGDTDSIFVHTGLTDIGKAMEIGRVLMRDVNKLYDCLEIAIDEVFSMMLLLKKKRYAALKVDGDKPSTRVVKGLDLVRRDWCVLSKKLGEAILDKILVQGGDREKIVENIHSLLEECSADARANKYPLESYVITKGLNKAPQDYPDAKGQPHLQVALYMLKAGKTVAVGDHVPYVICHQPSGSVDIGLDSNAAMAAHTPTAGEASVEAPASFSASAAASPEKSQQVADHEAAIARANAKASPEHKPAEKALPPAQRAWHPDDVKKSNGRVTVDIEWYLTQQVRGREAKQSGERVTGERVTGEPSDLAPRGAHRQA